MELKKGYKQTEVGVIPKGWDEKPLFEGIELHSGHHVIAHHCNTQGRGAPYITGPADFRNGIIRNSKFTEKPTTICRKDDILVTVKGSGAGTIILADGEYCISRQLMAVRVKKWDTAYVHVTLQRDSSLFGAAATGLIPGLSRGDILNKRIPIPPLHEQRAIAGALSDVDALLGALDQLIAKKRDLKQAAMQQLLTGQTRLPGFHGEWEMKRLGDCLLSRPDYGINAAAVPYSDKLPSYIRITDISEYGRFCPDPRVSVKAANADQYYLHEGDVVFARTGASVGKSYLYDTHDGELVFAGFLIRVRPNPETLVAAYLAAYVTTKPYWNWVHLMSMRSGQPGINGNEYAELPLALPTVAEQTAIAEVLTEMDAELAGLEQRRAKTRALKQGMMQELLTGRTRLV